MDILANKLKQNDNYTVILSVKDEVATGLNSNIINLFRQIGFNKIDDIKPRGSYLAMFSKGNVIVEETDNQLLEQEGSLDNGTNYYIESAGFSIGNISSIKLNKKEYSVNKRGMNIVVYDTSKDSVVDSVCFDIYESNIPAYR